MPKKDFNKKMALVCAAVSAIGLVIMLASNAFSRAPEIEIGSVRESMAGEKAVLCGIVKSVYDNGKDTVFLNLSSKSGSISAVFFRDVRGEASAIKKGSSACIEGSIQIYRSMPELIARKLVNKNETT